MEKYAMVSSLGTTSRGPSVAVVTAAPCAGLGLRLNDPYFTIRRTGQRRNTRLYGSHHRGWHKDVLNAQPLHESLLCCGYPRPRRQHIHLFNRRSISHKLESTVAFEVKALRRPGQPEAVRDGQSKAGENPYEGTRIPGSWKEGA